MFLDVLLLLIFAAVARLGEAPGASSSDVSRPVAPVLSSASAAALAFAAGLVIFVLAVSGLEVTAIGHSAASAASVEATPASYI